jgi:DNA-binding LacI/PurR family transcriptional regulator
VDFVHSAEGKGVRQPMDHLVELGHRRIVHIDGGRGPGSAERRRAYRAAIRRHGLESEVRVVPGDHTDLTRSGVEVPRDMSVVGYDDSRLSHLDGPDHRPPPELEPREAVSDPKLVVRGTSGH